MTDLAIPEDPVWTPQLYELRFIPNHQAAPLRLLPHGQ
jgi:hypothetical protein